MVIVWAIPLAASVVALGVLLGVLLGVSAARYRKRNMLEEGGTLASKWPSGTHGQPEEGAVQLEGNGGTSVPSDAAKDLVVAVYSDRCPREEHEAILEQLVKGLAKKGVPVTSHEWSGKELPAKWMEEHLEKAVVVVCVCNQAFHLEWEQSRPALPSTVAPLRQLLYAKIHNNESLSKFVVLLLKQSHKRFIPKYLQALPCFLVDSSGLDELGRVVKGLPPYQLHYQN